MLLHIPLPDQESVHLVDLDIGGVHQMGYALVSKVFSTYTRMEELALPLAQLQVELVIHHGQPQVGLHPLQRHRHRVRHERVVVLDLRVVAQNRVD